MPCRLSVNVLEFTLTDEHATDVSGEILGAVRDGGGYVHIAPIAGPEADILITPATTVSFERIALIQPTPDHPHEPWPTGDWFDEYS